MSRERKSNKEAKKKPLLTAKEKRAIKKGRGETKEGLGIDRTR